MMVKKKLKEQRHENVPLNLDLPLENIVDILLRLDVKTLTMIKCVSRSCRDFISDPSFIDTHRQQSMKNANFLFSHHPGCHFVDQNNLRLEVPFFSGRRNVKLYPVTCDLICYQERNGALSEICLCNPSTRDIQVLPNPQTKLFFHTVGYGYSAKTREYKVLRLADKGRSRSKIRGMHCQVYTLSDHKKIGHSNKWKPLTFPRCVCYVTIATNGKIYWLIDREESFRRLKTKELIISFDIASEEFSSISQPAGWQYDKEKYETSLVFMVVDGKLCIGNTGKMNNSGVLDIWILEEDFVWKMLHTINLLECSPPRGFEMNMFMVWFSLHPICMVNGEIIFQFGFHEYMACNLETKTLTSFPTFYHHFFGVFWESMFKLK